MRRIMEIRNPVLRYLVGFVGVTVGIIVVMGILYGLALLIPHFTFVDRVLFALFVGMGVSWCCLCGL